MPLKQVNLRQPERLVRKCSALKGRQKKQGNLRQLSLRLLLSRWAVTVGYLWPDLPYILVNMFITNVHGFSSNYINQPMRFSPILSEVHVPPSNPPFPITRPFTNCDETEIHLYLLASTGGHYSSIHVHRGQEPSGSETRDTITHTHSHIQILCQFSGLYFPEGVRKRARDTSTYSGIYSRERTWNLLSGDWLSFAPEGDTTFIILVSKHAQHLTSHGCVILSVQCGTEQTLLSSIMVSPYLYFSMKVNAMPQMLCQVGLILNLLTFALISCNNQL